MGGSTSIEGSQQFHWNIIKRKISSIKRDKQGDIWRRPARMGTTTRASTLALFFLGSHVIAERDPLCFEPAQSGRRMCRGFFPRFTWSQDKGCHSIIYGGCGGGRNLFVTVDECEAACGDDTSTRTNTRASSDLFLTLANRETDAFKFLNQQQLSVKARHFVLDNSATKCFVWIGE